jgi:hypothetical protein
MAKMRHNLMKSTPIVTLDISRQAGGHFGNSLHRIGQNIIRRGIRNSEIRR